MFCLRVGTEGDEILYLEFPLFTAEPLDEGTELTRTSDGAVVYLWDNEIAAVTQICMGAPSLTSYLLHHLIDQKFSDPN